MTSPNGKKCGECEVVQYSRTTVGHRHHLKPCLSCTVSESFEDCERGVEPSLPWSESYVENSRRDWVPKWFSSQTSINKAKHEEEKNKIASKRLVDKHGACNVIHNIKPSYATDFISDSFTSIVDLRWRLLLLFFSLAYVVGWLVFSFIWYCLALWHGDLGYMDMEDETFMPCVAHVDSFMTAFMFSVETQTTIGYGYRSVTEACWVGPTLVVIQSVFSALVDAILVGCIFVKIARPKKRAATIKFSHSAVIAARDGKLCLMFRIGDIRSSHIFDARIRAQLIRPRITQEEECIPLFSHPMEVGSSLGQNNLLLIWPLIITHVIDEKSPLYKYSKADLAENSFEIIVYFEGVVEQTGLVMQARTSYLPTEIKWGHRFSSHIVSMAERENKLSVDYSQFNITYPVDGTPSCSAYQLELSSGASTPSSTNSLPDGNHVNGKCKTKKNNNSDDFKCPHQLQLEKLQAKQHLDEDPPDYVGITSMDSDSGISPPLVPRIKATQTMEFPESDI